jgi:hypothetical protein
MISVVSADDSAFNYQIQKANMYHERAKSAGNIALMNYC